VRGTKSPLTGSFVPVLSCCQVAGIYAYAGRKAFNWVPEAFLRQARYVGREGGAGQPRYQNQDEIRPLSGWIDRRFCG